MYTIEQHVNDFNQQSSSNNNNTNNGNNNGNISEGSSPDMQYQGRLALHDEALHMGDGLDLPVFTQRSIITIQPSNDRAPMPVYTEGWQTTSANHFVPLSGLDFLIGAEKLVIQQTVELNDLVGGVVESENRYAVRVPRGETLFVAAEASSAWQRACCGSARALRLSLVDASRQRALLLRRSLACALCWCGCCLQEMEVYTAQGQLLGRILQQWTLLVPSFLIIDGAGQSRYRLDGPAYLLCNMKKESEFKILRRDGMIQEGSIKHVWDTELCLFNVLIDYPQDLDSETKALILGAGFLLEYMFFETSKRRKCAWCRC